MSVDKGKFAAMRDKFAQAQADPNSHRSGFDEHPDGNYKCVVSKAEIGESQASGRLQIAWYFTILEGALAGETIRDYQGLDKDDSWKWVFKRLNQFGIDTRSLQFDEVEEVLDLIVNSKVEVVVALKTNINQKTGEPYQNKYLNRVLTGLVIDGEAQPVPDSVDTADADEGPKNPFNIGDKVSFDMDGTPATGLVREIIDASNIKVMAKNKIWTLDVAQCTPA
jgi:hypothetical protein